MDEIVSSEQLIQHEGEFKKKTKNLHLSFLKIITENTQYGNWPSYHLL